jgi:hypothetical protein
LIILGVNAESFCKDLYKMLVPLLAPPIMKTGEVVTILFDICCKFIFAILNGNREKVADLAKY